jgi:DNA polymerase-3 subunit epsilon
VVRFDSLISKLESGPLPRAEFDSCLSRVKNHFNFELDSSLLKLFGLPLVEDEDKVCLQTHKNSYKDEIYCVVDIETNGNSPVKNQIIEIGAVKYQNGKVLDKFESYVYADYIPSSISRLTNIDVSDLEGAPSLKETLVKFKSFLNDSVFVAHNVNFDYSFISKSLETIGEERLLNRKLCTVNLSRKTIEADRHCLGFLREFLDIDVGEHHRAYADALACAKVLGECFKNIPQNVVTTEDLIKYSVGSVKKQKEHK